MKTVFLLIRHGQSEGNAIRMFCGQKDIPLSELGRQQAELTGQFLADRKIDAFYASDLCRAYDTAAAAAKYHGVVVKKEPMLREVSAGKWEGLTYDRIEEQFGEDYRRWKADLTCGCTGGETALQAQTRMRTCLCRIAEENPDATVCIGTHGGILRAFVGSVLNRSTSELRSVPVASNGSVTTLEYEDGVFRLVEYSHDAHLAEKQEQKNSVSQMLI